MHSSSRGEVAIKAVLLVPDQQTADSIAELVSTTPLDKDYQLCIEVAPGEAADEVRRARNLHGGIPVGYLASHEADALAAISSGADEALVLPALKRQHALGLIERAIIRAEMRRQQEKVQASAAQSEKLAALGTVVAGVAHEINNPLAAVLLSVEALRGIISPLRQVSEVIRHNAEVGRGLSVEELTWMARGVYRPTSGLEPDVLLDEMSAAVQTIADVVRDLRVFVRSEEDEQPRPVHVPEVIEQVLRIVGREITAHGVIERDYSDDIPPLVVPRTRLAQVFTNILVNAAHAIREVDRSVHRVRISIRADEEAVAVSISDTGPGIPPESVERIFDPFFTTKRESVGTGLGLSISRQIVRRLGGDLVVDSVHGVGATFIVLVPLPDPQVLRDAYRRSMLIDTPVTPTSRTTVMVVDDDERLLRAYSRVLRDNYDVILAADGQEAIELLVSGSAADVLITDLSLPEVDGEQLFTWLQREHPKLARATVFITAVATSSPYTDFLASLDNPVLEKPISKDRLLAAIEAARTRRDTP